MASLLKMSVEVTQIRIICFPIGTYCRCGDIVKVTVFGLPVYERTGEARRLLKLFRY